MDRRRGGLRCDVLCCEHSFLYLLFEASDFPQCFFLLHVAVSSTSFTFTNTCTYTNTCACVCVCVCAFCVCVFVLVLVFVFVIVWVCCVVWEGEERGSGGGGDGGWVVCLSFPPQCPSGLLKLNSFNRESE